MANPTIDHVERPSSQNAPVSTVGKAMILILSLVTLLATFICACRIILRKRQGYLGLDDWLLTFALLTLYAQDALNFVAAAKGGVGVPMKKLMETSIDSLELLFVILYACEIIYCVLMYTLKANILVSYNRILGKAGWVGWAIKGMFGLSTVWFITIFFMFLFQCRPVEAAWKPLGAHGECIDLIGFIWGMSVTNLILDWMILFLPVLLVLRLQMSRLQKAFAIGSFLLGSIACIASTTRAALTTTLNGGDLSKSGALVMIWTVIEPACGIISACLPFLTRLFGRFLRGTWTKIVEIRGGSSRRSGGAKNKKHYAPSVETVIKTCVEGTHITKSPTEYELHQLDVAGQHGEGQESVRNLIPSCGLFNYVSYLVHGSMGIGIF